MTKAQEIAWLDRAIAELGPHTYLGATLADQRHAIAANIANDFPALDLDDCYRTRTALLTERTALEKETWAQRDELDRLKAVAANLTGQIHELERKRHESVRHLRTAAQAALDDLRCFATA